MDLLFKIKNLERTLPSGVVFKVHYIASITDNELIAETYDSLIVSGNPNDSNFIPFDELTEDNVIQWIKDILGTEKIIEIKKNLLQQIESEKTPKISSGIPWVKYEPLPSIIEE